MRRREVRLVEQWLLALGDVTPRRVRPRRPLAPAQAGELAALAEAHGVLPLVARDMASAIAPAGGSGEASNPMPDVQRRVLAGAALSLAVRAGEREVLAEFARRGIAATVVKGSSFADRLYPPGLRTFRDSDILVPRDRLEAACEVMDQLAYRPVGRQGRHAEPYGQRAFLRDPGPTLVELHWNLVNSPAMRRR